MARLPSIMAVALLAGCVMAPETIHGTLVAVSDGDASGCYLKVAPLNGDQTNVWHKPSRNRALCDEARTLLGKNVLVHTDSEGYADDLKEAR